MNATTGPRASGPTLADLTANGVDQEGGQIAKAAQARTADVSDLGSDQGDPGLMPRPAVPPNSLVPAPAADAADVDDDDADAQAAISGAGGLGVDPGALNPQATADANASVNADQAIADEQAALSQAEADPSLGGDPDAGSDNAGLDGAGLDSGASQAAMASADAAVDQEMAAAGLTSDTMPVNGPPPTGGPGGVQGVQTPMGDPSLQAELDDELGAQDQAHQAFQTAASTANAGNMVSPRAAALAAAQAIPSSGPVDPSQGGDPQQAPPGGGPGFPPGTGPNGQMGSPLNGPLGTPGNTATDVATRQKAIQDDLNQAQTIYTQMAADRYKWISTMQRIWADMRTSILENLMGMIKNKIQTFQKMNQGIMAAMFGDQ